VLSVSAATSAIPSIRRATKDDLMAVEALLREQSLPTDGVAALFDVDAAQFVLALNGPEIIGVAGVEVCGAFGLLRSVAVRRDWQHHGVGRQLVAHVLTEGETRGVAALYLLTTTAEPYFLRFGFTRIDRSDVPDAVAGTVEFTSACPASATVMHRLLVGSA